MSTIYTYPPEEVPLNSDTEYLEEVRDRDDLSTLPLIAVPSPVASITLGTAKDAATPLPISKFLILLMLTAVFPLSFEVIYPFINAMIVEIGVTDDPERVGFYSGLVESALSLMGFIMILPWGYLSDRLGRKPMILIGFASLAVSMTSFGLSKSLAGIIASRCIGGGLGATWATMKVMTGEITDRTNQDLAFSLLSISYRLGQIGGLPLGGLLAHPEKRFSWFRTAFWVENPYLLPCLVGAAIAALSIIPGAIFIEETLRLKRKQRRKADKNWRSVLTPTVLSLLFNNIIMGFSSKIVFSIFPLFAYTPITSGGLGMSEAQIGTAMAMRSLVQIILMLVYSYVIRMMGTLRAYRLGMAFWVASVLYFPFLNWVARTQSLGSESFVLQAALLGFYFIWSIAGFCWTSLNSLVNDASPSAEALSLTTGISQMSLVIPQTVAPALGNSLFAASVHQNILGGHFIWVVMLVTTVFGWFHSLSLTSPTHDWRVDNDDE